MSTLYIGFVAGFLTAWKLLPWVGKKLEERKNKP